MASLADFPEVIGFFSYSREDDESYKGRLSGLREAIQHELAAQLGRSKAAFRLWQDKEAIAPGKLWEEEIKAAVGQSVFFVPIVTPRAVNSDYCKFEFDAFLAREHALGRTDLVFPILYVPVPALASEAQRRDHPVLSVIGKRQYVDWQTFRYSDVHTPAMREEIARFCNKIVEALHQTWLTPEERRHQEDLEAQRRAEEDRRRQEAEAKRRAEEEVQQRRLAEDRQKREAEAERSRMAALEAKAREEEIRHQRQAELEQRKAETEQRRTEERRLREETEAKRHAEAEERRRLQASLAHPMWSPSRPMLVVGSILGVALLGAIGVWLAESHPSAPATSTPAASPTATPSAPITPMPAPVAPPPPVLPPQVTPAPAPSVPRQQATATPLSAVQERALKPGDTFWECSKCPQMLVVPAGAFMMGSPDYRPNDLDPTGPPHKVTIAQQFAVARFELTFDQWDACVADGACNRWGKWGGPKWGGLGTQPVISASWSEANTYVTWLAKKTGKPYRLLSESEYEYAARAGTTTAYPWGDNIKLNGQAMANCNGCGSQWDNRKTAPVGSFPPNKFGLYDMVGNVNEWTEDCYHDNYNGAPTDGSARSALNCAERVVRGGAWDDPTYYLQSADRKGLKFGSANESLGLRVARALLAP